ncbi:MAG: MotA/TolQ/ExbB proton channel family protein [Spirochaetales bacterium]|nr:MotA/TolQ/ExbB proton channel family protein [Spirochaetales bacterium]
MYPLLICSLMTLAIVIERAFVFFRSGIKRKDLPSIPEVFGSGKADVVRSSLARNSAPVRILVREIFLRRNEPEEAIERDISLLGDRLLNSLKNRLHLLALIGKIAPMIGLLGTVTGMVRAFQTIASVDAVPDASLLAGGIWEALITTVFGLIVGIPALIAYHLYLGRLRHIAFQMKHTGEELISLIKR